MSARIFIETSGCAFNAADGEALAGVLVRSGYDIVDTESDADLVILNTCTVKDKTFRTFGRRLASFAASGVGKAVVVAGCIPKAHERSGFLDHVSTLGPDAIEHAAAVVRETLRGRVVHELGGNPSRRLSLPRLRRNHAVEILPIARGCRSACTFCQTRLARGRLVSFPVEEILAQAREAVNDGARILWITAQDVGAYGHDIGSDILALMERIIELPGDFQVRLGMSSPRWIAARLSGCLDLLAHPRFFKFMHVPVQSGSERIVAHMKRDGSVTEFEAISDAFRSRFETGTLVTDLIVGYPEETDDDFNATLELVRRARLGFVNISKFSPRPGTAAAGMKQLPHRIVSDRSRRLMAAVREIGTQELEAAVGSRRNVVVEQAGVKGFNIARDRDYRSILVPSAHAPGSALDLLITGARPFHLQARVV